MRYTCFNQHMRLSFNNAYVLSTLVWVGTLLLMMQFCQLIPSGVVKKCKLERIQITLLARVESMLRCLKKGCSDHRLATLFPWC